jgi:hypothetical protein
MPMLGMPTPPGRDNLAPEPSHLDSTESRLMLIHWPSGDAANYSGWLLPHSLCPPCAFCSWASSSHAKSCMIHLNCPSSDRMFMRALLRRPRATFGRGVNFPGCDMLHWTQPRHPPLA